MPPPTAKRIRRPPRDMRRLSRTLAAAARKPLESATHLRYSRPMPLGPHHPPSPGALAAHRARRIALAALYWGPIVFLAATATLLFALWRHQDLSGVYYAGVVILAGLGVASGFSLQRRLGDISAALERSQRSSTVGLLTAGFAHEMKNALTV